MSSDPKSRLSNRFSALSSSHPILSCEDSARLERTLLDSDTKVWEAMRSVGQQLGRGILGEWEMARRSPRNLSVFALIGKGHNGGDALLALYEMACRGAIGNVVLAIASPLAGLKVNTKRAFDLLEGALESASLRVLCGSAQREEAWLAEIEETLRSQAFDVSIDGLLGMSFKAPLRTMARGAIERVNEAPLIGMRVAVDLPSGLGEVSDEIAFRADVTFAAGILKKPLLDRNRESSIGCIRYFDIGFFGENFDSSERVIANTILDSLRARRPVQSDKRTFGHLLVIAGSRSMPGALMMAVRSALQSGVGLVTACAPESLVPQLACQIPEAMWIPWPETPSGGLALEGLHLLRELKFNPTALLVGPGMGAEHETLAMLVDVLKDWNSPLVVDADALRPEILEVVKAPFIATPHLGEFQRLLGREVIDSDIDRDLKDLAKRSSGAFVLKGPNTRVADGDHLFVNTTGNSVLARGGSGDLLAGMAAGLFAGAPREPLKVACQAVYWHGCAADRLAARKGQVAVRATDLLDTYAEALMMVPYGEGNNA